MIFISFNNCRVSVRWEAILQNALHSSEQALLQPRFMLIKSRSTDTMLKCYDSGDGQRELTLKARL